MDRNNLSITLLNFRATMKLDKNPAGLEIDKWMKVLNRMDAARPSILAPYKVRQVCKRV